MAELPNADTLTQGIATAPGDLPLSDVYARQLAQIQQFRHDNTIEPLGPCPGEPVEVWATSGNMVPLERASVYYTTDGRQPDARTSAMLPMERVRMDWEPRVGFLTRWRAVIPAQSAGTVVRYRIGGWRTEAAQAHDGEPDLWAHDGQGHWYRYSGATGVTTFAYHMEPPEAAAPGWIRDAVIYQIFLDRFHPGTADGAFPAGRGPKQLHGGTLHGVRLALPYLADLGVSCLWLSPINPAESYHRYDATDYYHVDPSLGGDDALRQLVDAAHQRGLRIMLDFVPNHCSWHHPAFEAAQRDPFAPTASWFTFDERPHRYRSFLDSQPFLPTFNTDDPGARAYIIGSAVQWLRDYGVDAFRLDHAIGPSMDFWVAMRVATRAVAPECFTVGEVTDTPEALRRFRGRLDAVLDFPLARALRLTFARDDWDATRFDNFLTAYARYMASGPGTVSFLDNHDLNRFLYVAANQLPRLKLAALCQFTLERPPTIYYGTEIGLTHGEDIDVGADGDAAARADMSWDERQWNQDLLGFYRRLIHLRRERRALRHGSRRTVHLDAAAGTYAYLRSLPEDQTGGSEDVLSAFNLSEHTRAIPLDLRTRGPGWQVLLATDHADARQASSAVLTLAPRSGAALGYVR